MVHAIVGLSAFSDVISSHAGELVVIDFWASWCGPCRNIAPVVEQLSARYAGQGVFFAKVQQDEPSGENEAVIAVKGVRAFPTFHFYKDGQLVDEMKGADPGTLQQKVEALKGTSSFGGQGQTLGGGAGAGETQEQRAKRMAEARQARVRAMEEEMRKAKAAAGMGGAAAPPASEDTAARQQAEAALLGSSSAATQEAPMDVEGTAAVAIPDASDVDNDDDAALQMALQMSVQGEAGSAAPADDTTGTTEAAPELPDDNPIVGQLKEMGFPDGRTRKAVLLGGGSLEGALQWLTEHEEDADVDAPLTEEQVRAHLGGGGGGGSAAEGAGAATRTPLTEEERKQKEAEMKAKIAQRRKEKAEIEAAAERQREMDRRRTGQERAKIQEERDRLARKREAEKRRREKQEQERERQRLREQLARDKEERRARGGKLASRLDADGYNPAVPQYEAPASAAAPGAATAASASVSASACDDQGQSGGDQPRNPMPTIEGGIRNLERTYVGVQPGKALNVLHTMLTRITENPDEEKYRSVNSQSKAFKRTFESYVGHIAILRALGFAKVEDRWVLSADDMNIELMEQVRAMLERASKQFEDTA